MASPAPAPGPAQAKIAKRRIKTLAFLDTVMTSLHLIGVVAAIAAMIFLFIVGLVKAWTGTIHLVLNILPFVEPTTHFVNGLESLLKGIELLVLAPLVFLVFTTTSAYAGRIHKAILSLTQDNPTDGHRGQTEYQHASDHLRCTHDMLHQVKQIIAGLFVALILTDFVGKIFRDAVLTIYTVAPEAIALALAIAYYYVLTCKTRHS